MSREGETDGGVDGPSSDSERAPPPKKGPPPMQLDFDDERDGGRSTGAPDRFDSDDSSEPVSLSDLEMIMAPGVLPPPLAPRAAAPDTPASPIEKPTADKPTADRRPGAPARPDHERTPIPGDADLGDIAMMAALNPPSRNPPKPSPPAAKAKPKQAGQPAATTHDKPSSPGRRFPQPTKRPDPITRRVDDEPPSTPPGPVAPTRAESGSGLHDLRMIMQMHEADQDPEAVDDDMLNLSGGLFKGDAPLAPIIAPDLSALSVDGDVQRQRGAAAKTSRPPSSRRKRRKEAAATPSTRPGSKRRGSAPSERPSKKKPSTAPAPQGPRDEAQSTQSRSTFWLLVLAAAAVGAYFAFFRSGGEQTPTTSDTKERAASDTATREVSGTESGAQTQTETETETDTETETQTATAVASDTATSTGTLFGTLPTATGTSEISETTGQQTGWGSATGANPSSTGTGTGKEAPATAAFDRGAASAALASAAGQASGCRSAGDPTGTASLQVTFSTSGRATSANVMGPPFAGTATGGCIARMFRSVTVPPFSGDPVTVSKTVSIR